MRERYCEADYRRAIVFAGELVKTLHGIALRAPESKNAELATNPYIEVLGGLGQLWESKRLKDLGVPQKPSALGQMLVLGGLGALGGRAIGSLADSAFNTKRMKFKRLGTAVGSAVGLAPGLFSALANYYGEKPAWTESYYNNPKVGGMHNPPTNINVQNFQNAVWHDISMASKLPTNLKAAASGLVHAAANLPDKTRNSSFVTPWDITRVAIGMGSGLASGWLVGKTMGAVFGADQKTQDFFKNTGVAVGAIKAVIPVAFGDEPFAY